MRSNRALATLLDGPRCDACVAKAAAIPPEGVNRAVAVWVRRGNVVRERRPCPACGANRLVSRAVFDKPETGFFVGVALGAGTRGRRRR